MRDELAAMKTSAEQLGYPVHKVWAPDDALKDLPYLILEVPPSGDGEESVASTSGSLLADVRVKAVAGSPDGALEALQRLRDLWSPLRSWTRLTVAGRVVWIKYERTEGRIYVDRDFKLPPSNRHPAVGVDSYVLSSEPA